ncbi:MULTISPECIES: PopZ family protein [unclassified Mesorhizobium]|uniref:PopZ family protein n=1 Tax=unclassified Mesorhizobium TaxID=325217 RepID=UPI001FCD00F6|nr:MULTISPECIES: PopZ family protein [unclassified Mesorhizobium]
MEEILASIRRIIEDSDTGRKPPEDSSDLRQDLEPSAVISEAETFRSELRGSVDVRKSVTLADVQAQIASDPAPAARFDAEPVPSSEPRAFSGGFDRFGQDAPVNSSEVDDGEEKPVAETVAEWRRDLVIEKAPSSPTETRGETDVSNAEASSAFNIEERVDPAIEARANQPRHVEPAASASDDLAKPSLVSEQTSRQVAASFGELSEAFASRSKKTFDEMAEDMLRPMLQDWLDNNLPTLVERLVREEIERVARGT